MQKCLFSLTILILLTACSTGEKRINAANGLSWTLQELVGKSKKWSEVASKAEKRSDKQEAAEKGIDYAERCLERAPEEAGCYYYRAINTGLYYEAHVVGYQKGVKQMIEDAHQVIKLQESYDHAGAYRLLGELYTKLPQTTVHPDDITRDLDKAESYLRKATRLEPSYPENHLLLAETLLAKKDITGALEALTTAKELAPRWKRDRSYSDWIDASNDLEKRIAVTSN